MASLQSAERRAGRVKLASRAAPWRSWLAHGRYLMGFEQHTPAILAAQRLSTQRWLDASDVDYQRVRAALLECREP